MDAAKVNGINGHIGKYFNIASDWQTWRDTDSVAEIPERLAQLTAAFFGVKGLLAPILFGALAVVLLTVAAGAVGSWLHSLPVLAGGAVLVYLQYRRM